MISKKSVQHFLLILLTCLTIFSALPILSNQVLYKIILISLWIFLFIYNILNMKINFTRLSIFIVCMWFFYVIYSLIMFQIFGEGYTNGHFFYVITLAIFVFVNGHFIYDYKQKDFLSIVVTYIIASFIVVVYIFYNFFYGVDYLNTQEYIYRNKNSIGPIIVTNLLLIIVIKDYIKVWGRWIFLIFASFFIYVLLLTNNRAGIVQIVLTVIAYLLIQYKNKRRKNPLTMKIKHILYILIISISLLFLVAYFFDFAKKIFELVKWSLNLNRVGNLDEYSSGRISLYKQALDEAVYKHPLRGDGVWYVDLFYLSLIAEVGLIGFIPIFLILVSILIKIVTTKLKGESQYVLMILLGLQLLIASLFEAFPPFGPGTITFLFWLLLGFYSKK